MKNEDMGYKDIKHKTKRKQSLLLLSKLDFDFFEKWTKKAAGEIFLVMITKINCQCSGHLNIDINIQDIEDVSSIKIYCHCGGRLNIYTNCSLLKHLSEHIKFKMFAPN